MKLAIALAWFSVVAIVWDKPWTPPKNPDPQKILNEAQADARAKRYEIALAKHVWFHEHALEVAPSMSGVRLSFALSYWMQLGKTYPPALAKLKSIRDKTLDRVAPEDGKKIAFEDFHDLAAINRTLGEDEITADAFRSLDVSDPTTAARAYGIAEPALILSKQYELCGKYIKPEASLRRMADSYRMMRKFEEQRRAGAAMPEFAAPKFINDGTTLVALLVVNERQAEAESAVEELKKAPGDAAFQQRLAAELEKALHGEVPIPWP